MFIILCAEIVKKLSSKSHKEDQDTPDEITVPEALSPRWSPTHSEEKPAFMQSGTSVEQGGSSEQKSRDPPKSSMSDLACKLEDMKLSDSPAHAP